MSKVILITGATGKQGGAVVKALLNSPQAAEFTLACLTRKTDSASAKALAAKSPNIKLVEGNLDDPDAAFKKATETAGPVWGVFSVQLAIGNGANPESEERQGKALIDAALANKTKFFVYSSVDRGGDKRSWSNPTIIPHFLSKHHVEQHLTEKANGRMDWAILRPVAFMEAFTPGMEGNVFNAMWRSLIGGPKIQFVATRDIGIFAAKAFSAPTEYRGRAISLAGDEVTYDEMEQIFLEKTGKNLPRAFLILTYGVWYGVKEFRLMMNWFREEGCHADIAALRKMHPALLDLRGWLEEESAWEMKH